MHRRRPIGPHSYHQYEIRASVRGISPEVWRRFLLTADATVDELATVISALFLWDDDCWTLHIRGRQFPYLSADESVDESLNVVLGDLGLESGDRFTYTGLEPGRWVVDFHVEVKRETIGTCRTPYCVGGRRAPPLDEFDEPADYMEALHILEHPEHPDFGVMIARFGPDFHPEAFDERATNRIFELLRFDEPSDHFPPWNSGPWLPENSD